MVYAPKVNLNGTSARELIEQHSDAAHAVRQAYVAVQKCAPHGRDFQTASPEDYRLARQQHIRWLSQLIEIITEIEQVGIDILAQVE